MPYTGKKLVVCAIYDIASTPVKQALNFVETLENVNQFIVWGFAREKNKGKCIFYSIHL